MAKIKIVFCALALALNASSGMSSELNQDAVLRPVPTVQGLTPLDIHNRADRIILRRMLNEEEKGTAKPSWFRHPVKRFDYWADNNPDAYRKFKTRAIPNAQFVGVMIGATCSVLSLFI